MTTFAPGPIASLRICVALNLRSSVPGVQHRCLESCGLSNKWTDEQEGQRSPDPADRTSRGYLDVVFYWIALSLFIS